MAPETVPPEVTRVARIPCIFSTWRSPTVEVRWRSPSLILSTWTDPRPVLASRDAWLIGIVTWRVSSVLGRGAIWDIVTVTPSEDTASAEGEDVVDDGDKDEDDDDDDEVEREMVPWAEEVTRRWVGNVGGIWTRTVERSVVEMGISIEVRVE
jgi:hypothetical protein